MLGGQPPFGLRKSERRLISPKAREKFPEPNCSGLAGACANITQVSGLRSGGEISLDKHDGGVVKLRF
jgi:hypothetical protein